VRRVEAYLGLERDALVALIPTGALRRAVSDAPRNVFRLRHAERSKDSYYLPEADVPDSLKAEWGAYVRYKTAAVTSLQRQTKGVWRTRPADSMGSNMRRWSSMTLTGRTVPTASKNWSLIRAIFGFIRRMHETGLPSGELPVSPSLAVFACPEPVLDYASFLTERSGDIEHGGVLSVVQFAKSLVHPRTGYLTQKPEFADALQVDRSEWVNTCGRAFEVYQAAAKRLAGSLQMSRNPWDPIKQYVALAAPIQPFVDGLREFERDIRRMPEGTISYAVAFRDLLLMRLLVSNLNRPGFPGGPLV
jgi:hypothetical protein